MYLQTDDRFLLPSIASGGCFIMAAVWHIVMITKKDISPEKLSYDILADKLVAISQNSNPMITLDAYVNSYDAIAKHYGVRIMAKARHAKPEYICKGYEQEILVYNLAGKTHSTAGDGNGVTTFDPLGYSSFPLFGKLVSKRILAWDKVE